METVKLSKDILENAKSLLFVLEELQWKEN
jgi:hypothetical protein